MDINPQTNCCGVRYPRSYRLNKLSIAAVCLFLAVGFALTGVACYKSKNNVDLCSGVLVILSTVLIVVALVILCYSYHNGTYFHIICPCCNDPNMSLLDFSSVHDNTNEDYLNTTH